VSGMNRAAAVPMYAAAIDAGTGGRAAALHSDIRWRAGLSRLMVLLETLPVNSVASS